MAKRCELEVPGSPEQLRCNCQVELFKVTSLSGMVAAVSAVICKYIFSFVPESPQRISQRQYVANCVQNVAPSCHIENGTEANVQVLEARCYAEGETRGTQALTRPMVTEDVRNTPELGDPSIPMLQNCWQSTQCVMYDV